MEAMSEYQLVVRFSNNERFKYYLNWLTNIFHLYTAIIGHVFVGASDWASP